MFSGDVHGQMVAEYSNSCWLCDFTCLDVLLTDIGSSIVGRPWLTIVIDTYSRCVMGFHIGFEAPSSQSLILALRHAILPKQYGSEYNLYNEWRTYGIPEHLYVDGNSCINLDYLNVIAVQLGFVLHQHNRPINAGVIERCLRTFNNQLFSTLPGYIEPGFSASTQPASTHTCLTLSELERLLVGYIVDNYNQHVDSRVGNQTMFRRWEAGLTSPPRMISEQDLVI